MDIWSRMKWGVLATLVTLSSGIDAASAQSGPQLGKLVVGASVTSAAREKAAPMPGPYEIVTLEAGEEIKGAASSGRPIPPYVEPALRSPSPLGQGFGGEVEPNGTFATATPLPSNNTAVRAALWPNGDVDFYSFTANAGDRVYAAVMTSASAGSSTDAQLTLLASDGSTVIEFDDDNGTFAALSPSIAGATIPSNGTYFLQVNDFTAGTTSQRFYELHLRVQSGTPTPEVEPNDTPATANPLPANGWVSGTRDPALATEQDWYAIQLNAGDTVFLSLDLDPERDGVTWNGRLGFGLFGDTSNQILTVNDAGSADAIPSEAMWMTVKDAGTYYAFVDSATAAVGGPTATYHLSVTVRPNVDEGVNCTTYTSTDVPQTIGPGTGLVSSTITVPGNPRVADLDVQITLNHALMADVDAHLRSPAGQNLGLFTDIGATTTGGQTQMDLWFDDEAGIVPGFTVLRGVRYKPENNSTAGTASTSGAYRLNWFDGIDAGGTWTLDLRDDLANTSGGTLTSWALRICEAPPPPTCAAGFAPVTVYTTNFETGDGGFTSGGTNNQWARGLPATAATTTANPIAAFDSCNSGSNCFKTNLTGPYAASSNQDLLSPAIDLTGLQPPVVVNWAQRHQVETANFDRYFVDLQQVGGANAVRLYEWLDPTPISASAGTGNPQVNIGGAVGWGVLSRRADSLAGQNVELRFNLTSDSSVQFGGVAVDDVSITACRALSADLSITKTDGVASAIPGNNTTYTIVASNAGPDPVTGATLSDTFPASCSSVSWTCAGAGGGSCTAAGSGNLNDSVNLPVGGSVTYTAVCAIAPAATGTLSNTATVSSSVTDPTPGNNSATDTTTLTPQANLGITKTNGVSQVSAGSNTTYTIVASNPGPSNAPGTTVSDAFPAECTSVSWSCTGTGGAICPAASGSGNINDTATLPAGASLSYSATCAIAASATGTLSNTATVEPGAGVEDPVLGNNSATDADAIVGLQADVSITKTDGQASSIPGNPITYTIVASNAGPAAATGVTVADSFPATVTGVSWTCVGAAGGTCTASGSGNINQTVNLPAGGSVTFTASGTIASTATGTLSNTATATVAAPVIDPNPANNSATDSNTLTPQANLSITLTDSPDPVVAGANISYVATATNNGPSTAQDVAISLPLPTNTTLVSATGGSCSGTTCTFAGATAPAATRTVTYVVRVAPSVTQGSNVSATASVASPTTDPVPGNNSATATTAVDARADLQVSLTASVAQALTNAPVSFTATSVNNGPSDAQNVSVTVDLAPGFRYASHTATGATCATPAAGATGAVVCTWAGATVPAATRSVTVIASAGNAGNLSVSASTASTTTDPVANNNASSAAVAVSLPAVVPMLGREGLLLLMLMFGLAGLVTLRRPM